MQGFNKYYPPDYDPKRGGLNKQQGKHALGDRARKLDQGILIIRFELPFSIWCEGCDNHIGQGVRYNAEKKKVGNYYSTPIWSFRMKCHLCENWFEIQTDPKNTRYVVTTGARAKVEDYDPDDAGVIKLKDDDEAKRLEDPFAKIEKDIQDQANSKIALPHLAELHELSEKQWSDPFKQSQILRQRFRQEKREYQEREKQAREIKDKYSLNIDLVDEEESDRIEASQTDFTSARAQDSAVKRLKVAKAGLLNKATKSLSTATSKQSLLEDIRLNTRLRNDPFSKGFTPIFKAKSSKQGSKHI